MLNTACAPGNGREGSSGNTSNSSPFLSCEEARFFALINIYRSQNRISRLVLSQSALDATRWMSEDMGESAYFSHTDSLGRSPFARAPAFGFNFCTGENIAAGNYDANSTFCQWRNSPGHNSNMLNSNHRSMGIGRVSVPGSPYGVYWTNKFGSGSDDTIASPGSYESGCTLPSQIPSC